MRTVKSVKREESYPSRGQSLAVRVWAHGQGTVEPYTSICTTVSALENEEDEILSTFSYKAHS